MAGRRDERGFTLIEIVLAVTILAIITSFIYASLTGAIRSSQIGSAKNEVATLGTLIVSMIASDVSEASLYSPQSASGRLSLEQVVQGSDTGAIAGQPQWIFIGEDRAEGDSDLDFLGFTTSDREIVYMGEYDRDTDEYVLSRRVRPGISSDPLQGGQRIELLRGQLNNEAAYPFRFVGINFTYCQDLQQLETNNCVKTWDTRRGPAQLPRAVRIELTAAGPADEVLKYVTVTPIFMAETGS
ncbi:MAG: prepilin-type N-terminal cleavage/methylation domain-containing protein [Myxococcales bacterium]|nr:prepilin-type N-terminal cleavage/methylation domain-containing protein [Myxococcales bacterium]